MAPKYKVTYFNVTALAEPIRFLFSYGNIPFEDNRFDRDQWPDIKPTTPFGQVPILEIDGKAYNQSMAIARYVAKLVKLAGKDDLEALEIDAMVDNVNDLRAKIAQYSYEADEEVKERKREPLVKETIPFIAGKLEEAAAKNKGHLVGGALTWADVYFAALIEYMNFMVKFDLLEKYPNLRKVRETVLAAPGIKEWVAKRPKTDV